MIELIKSNYGHIDETMNFAADPQVYMGITLHSALLCPQSLRFRLAMTDSLIDLYQGHQRIAQLNVDSFFGSAMAGSFFLTQVLVAAGYQFELTQLEPRIGQENLKTPRESVSTFLALLQVDSRDQRFFPRKGRLLHLQFETAAWERHPGERYQKYFLDAQGFFPLDDQFSLLARMQLGSSKGGPIPLQRQYFLGGSGSFYGLKNEERVGRNIQAITIGLQYELWPQRYVVAHWNMGNTFRQWSWEPHYSQYITGGGITLGAATPVGPIEFTAMASNQRSLFAYLQIGFNF
jgi:outer membrane protein assembly factor BamA